MADVSRASSSRFTICAAPGVYQVQTLISNVILIGHPADDSWVLIDAGMPGFSCRILEAARRAFGTAAKLNAILMTHGHFDHRGSLDAILRHHDVPVYAHTSEIPHLNGTRPYPPADPLAGGGFMAWSSPLYPRRPIDVGPRLLALPRDGSIPGLPGWHWLHTPGHTDGHVAFFRPQDRVLVSGDAVITVKQESALAVFTQRKHIHRPPAYFTPDWDRARESVRRLAALQPESIVAGHGLPMRGGAMRAQLAVLAARFDEIARPRYGRYTKHPTTTAGMPRPLGARP